MAQVVVEMSSDEAKLYRGMQRLIEQQQKLETGLKKTGAAGKKAGDDTSKAMKSDFFSKQLVDLKAVATGYFSIQTAIQAVTKAMEEQKQVAEAAATVQVNVAGGQAAVLKNLGDVSKEESDRFFANLDRIRSDSKFSSIVPIQYAASDILSATGGNQEQTLDILRAVTPLFGTTPDQMASFGGALADMQKASGITDAKQAAALMLGIQGQARFTSLDAFKNVAPALMAVDIASSGDRLTDTREGAALFAGIGSQIGDTEGNLTKGAVVALATNLRNTLKDVAPELKTTFERMEFVRNNPTLEVMGIGNPEAKADFEAMDESMKKLITDSLASAREKQMIATGIKDLAASEGRALKPSERKALLKTQLTSIEEDSLKFDPQMQRMSLRDAVLASGFRGATKSVAEELLTGGDTAASKNVAEAFAKIQASEEAFARKADQLSSATPALRSKTTTDAFQGNVEEFLQNDDKTREAVARAALFGKDGQPGALKATRTWSQGAAQFGDTSAEWKFAQRMAFMGPEDAAIGLLEEQRNSIEPLMPYELMRPENREKIDLLNKQIRELEQFRDSFQGVDPQMAEQTAAINRQTEVIERNAGGNFGRNVNAQAGRHAE